MATSSSGKHGGETLEHLLDEARASGHRVPKHRSDLLPIDMTDHQQLKVIATHVPPPLFAIRATLSEVEIPAQDPSPKSAQNQKGT